MSAGKYDFTIEEGATFSMPISYKNSAEVLHDLSSDTIRMKIKGSPGGTVYASTETETQTNPTPQVLTLIDVYTKVITSSDTTRVAVTDFVSSGGTDTATITITDYANIPVGTTITIANNLGVEKIFTSDDEASGTDHDTWMTYGSNNTTADNLYNMFYESVNSAWTVATDPEANVVTLTRSTPTLTNYNIKMSMTATATAALDFETAVYDLELVSGTTVTRLLEGIVTLSREISA
jgi:hypothetical protein